MLLLNGPAEEVYWRGYLHARLADRRPRRAVVAGTALAYASYHGVTLPGLLGSWPVALAILAAVWGAGCLWGWLRECTGSLWPALLSHGLATAGYMLVYWSRFGCS